MRKRVQIDYSKEKCLTDQHFAKELTMANIVKKLEKGIMPQLREGLIYSTDIGLRNLQDVVDFQRHVEEVYNQLPTEIKQKMGNNIENFESVIFNSENKDLLLKHGLLVQKRDEHQELLNAINAMKVSEPSLEDQK